jgi:hypothetical protein
VGAGAVTVKKIEVTPPARREETRSWPSGGAALEELAQMVSVENGHLMAVFTLSIAGRAIFVICRNGWCPSLGV